MFRRFISLFRVRPSPLALPRLTLETTLLAAASPRYVDLSAAVCEYSGRIEDHGELRPERAPATMAWITSDLSKSGIMGDAPAGTAEKVSPWLDRYAARAASITEVARSGQRTASLA